MVDIIVANKNNTFTKEDLQNRPLGELKNIARLAAPVETVTRPANYAGMGPAPSGNAGTFLASMGKSGGLTGSCMAQPCSALRAAWRSSASAQPGSNARPA